MGFDGAFRLLAGMIEPSLGFSVCGEDRRLDPAHVERPHCSGPTQGAREEIVMLKYLSAAVIACA